MGHLSHHTQIKTLSKINTRDQNTFVVRGGKFLFEMGEPLAGIYRVNSGAIKLYRCNKGGEEQIIGFRMAGDLIGLDALAEGISHSSAVALDTSNITLIPFESLLNNNNKIDYHNIIMEIGSSYNRNNERTMMLSHCKAERRLAWFFLKFSDDLSKRGLSGNEFTLPMIRKDVALYLAIAAGTLSRIFTCFCEKGIIKVNHRSIELLDIAQLRKIACGSEDAKLKQ